MARVKMESMNGWDIEYDAETSKFLGIPPAIRPDEPYWQRNGRTLSRGDLAALKREILKRSMGEVKLMQSGWLHPRQDSISVPSVVEVAGIQDHRIRTKDGRLEKHWRRYAVADDAVIAKITEFRERRDAAVKAVLDEYNAYLETLDVHDLTEDEVRELLMASNPPSPVDG